jgi:hypothetical protein
MHESPAVGTLGKTLIGQGKPTDSVTLSKLRHSGQFQAYMRPEDISKRLFRALQP